MSSIEDRRALAKELFHKGYSAGRAAKEMGYASHGPITRIWSALGLRRTLPSAPTVKPPKPAPRPRTENALASNITRRLRAQAEAKPPKEPMGVPEAETASSISIHHLTWRTCRWPVGEKSGADQRFCGCGVEVEGKPYCSEHAEKARGNPVSAKELARSLRKVS